MAMLRPLENPTGIIRPHYHMAAWIGAPSGGGYQLAKLKLTRLRPPIFGKTLPHIDLQVEDLGGGPNF
jgi:hypothetical protein